MLQIINGHLKIAFVRETWGLDWKSYLTLLKIHVRVTWAAPHNWSSAGGPSSQSGVESKHRAGGGTQGREPGSQSREGQSQKTAQQEKAPGTSLTI